MINFDDLWQRENPNSIMDYRRIYNQYFGLMIKE